MQTLIDIATSRSNILVPSNMRLISSHGLQVSASKALLGHIVWLDILATASSGCGPFLGINTSYLLQSNTMQIHEVSGCQNWAAEALCEICSLKDWKAQQERQLKLSIIELAARGGAILQPLISGISQLDSTEIVDGPETPLRDPSTWNRDASKHITLAHARAAIIFLHVVVSGPNPHLEEIRRTIPFLVSSLKDLARRRILRSAPWPLCVAACFAVEEERRVLLGSFTKLNDVRNNSEEIPSRACTEAMVIAEKCYTSMEAGDALNWMQVMEKLDKRILLA